MYADALPVLPDQLGGELAESLDPKNNLKTAIDLFVREKLDALQGKVNDATVGELAGATQLARPQHGGARVLAPFIDLSFGTQDVLDNTCELRELVLKFDPQGGAVAPGDATGELPDPQNFNAHLRVGLDRLGNPDLGPTDGDIEDLAVDLFIPGDQFPGTKGRMTRVLLPIDKLR